VFNTVRFGTMFSTAVLASVWMFERARGVEFTAPPPGQRMARCAPFARALSRTDRPTENLLNGAFDNSGIFVCPPGCRFFGVSGRRRPTGLAADQQPYRPESWYR
jgi:hypothetical protein